MKTLTVRFVLSTVFFTTIWLLLVNCHSHGHSHDDNHGHSHEAPSFKYSKEANANAAPIQESKVSPDVWIKAIVSVFAISACPLVLLFFINVDNTDKHKRALEYLLSFASGGLLGDAFLHLIPHAVMEIPPSEGHAQGDGHVHSHAHGHSHGDDAVHSAHIGVGAWVLSGILSFLLVEVIMRSLKGETGHSHGHSHGGPKIEDKNKMAKDSPIAPPQKRSKNAESDSSDGERLRSRRSNSKGASKVGGEATTASHVTKHKADDSRSDKEDEEDETVDSKAPEVVQTHDMKVAAYLNLAADFTHNFTDGLAVGAGFLVGDGIGILTAVTVILHEIPHEIGDFAILMKAGCSKWKVSNMLCFHYNKCFSSLCSIVFAFVLQNAA